MRYVRLPGLLLAMMPFVLIGARSPAQTAPQDAANGFHDLMAAAESLQKSPLFPKTLEPDATLTLKRRALQDPPVRRALNLLRSGLAKPVALPRPDPARVNFPHLAKFRSLARLLMVEQYVLLAEGKVGVAVSSLRDGVRMGYLLMTDTLINGLVGVAVELIVITQIARHMPQLSARDCEQVIGLARERLNAPDPLLPVMEGERDVQMKMLREMFEEMHRAAGKEPSRTQEAEEEQDPEMEKILRQMRQNPEAMEAWQTEAVNLLKARYDLLFAELRRPPWERREIRQEMPDTPAGRLIGVMAQLTGSLRSAEAFTRAQANLQLLGMHAAIRRFLWEHDRLPSGLEELKPGRLAIDPYTGQPLIYRRLNDREYELYSAGPIVYNEEGQPSGRRDNIHLPRKRP